MGQHKYNPVAQLAKEGKLPSKSKPIGSAEARRRLETLIREKTGIDKLEAAMGIDRIYR